MMTSVKNLNKAISKVMDDVQLSTVDKVYIFVKDFVKDEATFLQSFEEFKKTLKQDIAVPLDSKKNSVEQKKKRTPSAYNVFIGERIKHLKLEHPESDGKVLMKMAIEEWKKRTVV